MAEPATYDESRNQYLAEYSEACENMRHYGNLHFATFTVFLAVIGGLSAFGLGVTATTQMPRPITTLSKVGGFIVTFLFWNLQERWGTYWYHFRQRAVELEERLGYCQHSVRPKPLIRFLNTVAAMRLFYLITGLFWICALFIP